METMATHNWYHLKDAFVDVHMVHPDISAPISLSNAKQLITTRTSSIFTDREALLDILRRYDYILTRRWVKRTGEQRRKVLLQARPDMPATHRPDFQAIRREKPQQIVDKTRYYDSFLLPSINIEDLVKPYNLLLFMDARGRHDPEVFANADSTQSTLRLAPMPSNLRPSTDILFSWIGMQIGEGLLTLEIQQKKLSFLRSCAEIILQDLPLHDTSITLQLPPPTSSSHSDVRPSDSGWPSLSRQILEAPYRIPDQFNFGRLKCFVSAKRDEAVDHIWALREDPSYFQSCILEWSQHRQENILDVKGNTDPGLGKDVFWESVLGDVVADAYLGFLSWHHSCKAFDEFENLRHKYGTSISLGDRLPEDFDVAIRHFDKSVDELLVTKTVHYKLAMPSSPPLRNHFVRSMHNNGVHVTSKSGSNTTPKSDNFLWLLERLWTSDHVRLFGLHNLLDEIERKLREEKLSRERVSPWIARILSDLSVLAEIRRQVGILRPGHSCSRCQVDKEQWTEFIDRMGPFQQVLQGCMVLFNFAGKTTPLTKFNYPSDKPMSAKVVKAMQEAERHLDHIWKEVDNQFIEHGAADIHELLAAVLPKRGISRTPDWIEPEEKPETHTHGIENVNARAALLDLEMRTEQTIESEASPLQPDKVKTRGKVIVSKALPEETVTEQLVEESPQLFVSKRGFRVFSTLFHNSSREKPPGEVPWSEFLSAMASVGFGIRKLDGSAWVFEPLNDLFRRSIIFHEPHPSSTIPYQVARRHGRRLERAFGWTGSSFTRG
ncbi:MAG: hypothetical protein Q9218_004275 [Villophora microphyllina]